MDELYAPGVVESVLECTTERGRVVCVCVCGGVCVWGVCVWEGAQVQDIVLLECFASRIMQFTNKIA